MKTLPNNNDGKQLRSLKWCLANFQSLHMPTNVKFLFLAQNMLLTVIQIIK